MQKVRLKKKRPEACSSQEITEFVNLILEGNQVQEGGLRDLVMDAQWLGFARLDGNLVSVAAVKTPRSSYRDRVFRHARSLADSTEFNVEFGWAYTQPRYEGKGFGSGLATLLLEGVSESVFATTGVENVAMRHILEARDFSMSGDPYQGRAESKVLYIRAQTVDESDSISSRSL